MGNEDQPIELYDEPLEASMRPQEQAPLRVAHLEDFETPFTLPAQDRAPYHRRFATLFIDESRTREGSTGRILQATNAFGEHFALKEFDGASVNEATHEYAAHRLVSGIKGYPTLYGQAQLDDHPVLVMEWIEGEDMLRFRSRMAIDDEGRASPLTVARLGRDLFDVLARTNVLEDKVAHGDLSLRNIMISTLGQSVEEQDQEGFFDLRLIDLGSACINGKSAGSDDAGVVRFAATPEFAAPELRNDKTNKSDGSISDSVNDVDAEQDDGTLPVGRCTPASDVYAAARILCMLLYSENSSSFMTVHETGNDITAVLLREPEVAVAVSRISSDLIPAPTSDEVVAALEMTDEPLADLLRCALDPDPRKRPSATEMRNALESFSASYTANIGHALRGEALEPCNAPFINKGLERFSLRARNTIRVVGKSVSFGLLVAVLVITALTTASVSVVAGWDGVQIAGAASEVLVGALLLPVILGAVVRGKEKHSIVGLIRGSIGIAVGAVVLMLIVMTGSFSPSSFKDLMTAAIFAVSAMSWCPFVLDCAFAPVAPRIRRRSKALPSGSNKSGDSGTKDQNSVSFLLGASGDTAD